MRVEHNALKFRNEILSLTLLAIAIAPSLTGCVGASDAKSMKPEQLVARGEYLVTIGGCNDCHTPWKMGEHGPEPDMTLQLSGHPASFPMPEPQFAEGPWIWQGAATNTAFAGPWGVSFAANLTSDPATGLVIEESAFKQALRTGKHYGAGRPILPPMPWFNYGRMTDEDLSAVYAFLRSIPAIENEVPSPIPPKQLMPLMSEKQ